MLWSRISGKEITTLMYILVFELNEHYSFNSHVIYFCFKLTCVHYDHCCLNLQQI